ncbi:MAG: PHB depolymerase family esterase [Eubacteriales bacterium]|nr:PHB depolymerase family esterase [Eubacteriales bacterium]
MKKRWVALTMTMALGVSALAGIGCSAEAETETETVMGAAEDAAAQAAATETEAETEMPAEPELDPAGNYSLIQNVFNWGSSYSKVIIPAADSNAEDYKVSVWRYGVDGSVLGQGERNITNAYASDAEGNAAEDGEYITLEMEVGAALGIGAPYYTNPESFKGQLKDWAECHYIIENTDSTEIWNQLDTVYHPDEEKFSTAKFEDAEYAIPYAYYEPEEDGADHPLVVWLHGAGSGGTDIGFVTGGMLVTNFVSEDVQNKFGGAHILLPQCETWWMDDGSEENLTTDGSSIYTESLKALIDNYVETHKGVDTNRIYIGGCSNGGFMTINMVVNYPEYFAAEFPICEAYNDEWLSDEQINVLASVPTWIVHSTNDPVVDIEKTAIPTYERIAAAGSENVHFTKYDQIIDPDYGNEYVGHFAWVPTLADLCTTDYDGSPVVVDEQEVTLYQWLALQSK